MMRTGQKNRIALLAAEEVDGVLDVRIYLGPAFEALELGRNASVAEVRKWAAESLNEVSGHVSGRKRYDEILRKVGTRLARLVLSEEGMSRLVRSYADADTLLLFTRSPGIPWEWMCPAPSHGELFPTLSEQWRVIRWHADLIRGALVVDLALNDVGGSPVLTIGGSGSEHGSIHSLSELCQGARCCAVLHLIGHQDGAGLSLRNGVVLDQEGIEAFPPIGPKGIVISACGAGAADMMTNIPAALAMHANCATWAPLVDILQQDAEALDSALRAELATENASLDRFMRCRRSDMPYLALYVRYGVRPHGR